MAAIPCVDYVSDSVPQIPARPIRVNPDAIQGRHVNFVFNMDLTPEQKDEAGAGVGAWTAWDIPAEHAAQIDDERGEDLIVVTVGNRAYWLDWQRFQDEWNWNAYAPIHRMVRIGPLPSNESVAKGGQAGEAYDLNMVNRFREMEVGLRDVPTGAAGAAWTVTVAEWGREERTERSTTRKTAARLRTRLTTKGKAFIVTLEHSANEPARIDWWRAVWDSVGRRTRETEPV